MYEADKKIFDSDRASGFTSGVIDVASRDDERTSYPEDDNGDSWDIADVPVEFHVAFLVSLRQELKAIRKLCRSTNVAIPESARWVVRLALRVLNTTSEHNSAVSAKTVV